MQSVKPGVTNGDTTQAEGISPGDVIADSSFDKLQNNSKIVFSKNPVPAGNSGSTAP
jgi:multidrug efflux system membrane fusion protein